MRLNQKFTMMVFCIVLIPVLLMALLFFSGMRQTLTEDRLRDIEADLTQTRANVEKAVDLCNMTTQVFLNNSNLLEFLSAAKQNETFSPQGLIAFYRGEVLAFERLVNANPYLYQVRVFYDNTRIPEMMPILYHTGRMERLAWTDRDWHSGTWQFDYADTLFPDEVSKPVRHLMCLVTTIDDFDLGDLGTLEVSVPMDDVMTDLFASPRDDARYFYVDQADAWYCHPSQTDFAAAHREELTHLLDEAPGSIDTVQIRLNGERVWVSSIPLGTIGGRYVAVTAHSALTRRLSQFQWLFLTGTVALLTVLAFGINRIVKAMLRRFYVVLDAILQVQDGNLAVTVPDLGTDEIGLLGKQVNVMVSRISLLMEENVNRQLLAKNSEIRALQSQINAHFLYNVLESIKMMAEVDEKYEIADAIHSLGQLLRYSMRNPSAIVTVEAEVENCRNYLTLMNLRFDYHVALENRLSPDVMQLPLPKMTLQPLIENAVVHGIGDAARDTVILLEAVDEAAVVELRIRDYGRGISTHDLESIRGRLAGEPDAAAGNSIGLKNVHDRLVMAFGSGAGLDITAEQQGACVHIRLPRDT
ncbi:sensor histidine kinase [Ruminococcaceae bacterium OttesenSCG-928-L11]|nr:sensor histidine kinase [Ruminococcaceae bacterium OttesenSCG-928-L11]